MSALPVPPRARLDVESRAWWNRLHAAEPIRAVAILEAHARLRREAEFHIRIRVRSLPTFPRSDIADLATQAADDALMSLLRKLDEYRGESRFWTWAYRFAALEAPVSVRRRVGRDRVGISWDPTRMLDAAHAGPSTEEHTEQRDLVSTIGRLISDTLTPYQRRVVIAVAVDGVSARALAEELHTTPGAIHKALHDARRKLRAGLQAEG